MRHAASWLIKTKYRMEYYEHDIVSFNVLGMDEMMEISKSKGTKIETIDEDEYRIDLYSYCDFFIEIIFRKELKIIKSIQGISPSDYADKYIELEDLQDL